MNKTMLTTPLLFGMIVAGVWMQISAASGKPRTYTTNFRLTENPISEGGRWINGKAAGLDWCNVATAPGLAFGVESGSRGYDDATALLKGNWGADQTVQATVHSVNPNDNISEEVELRLRSSLSAHSATGYEINFRCSKTEKAYSEIVRWNGPLGNFTYLSQHNGSQYGVADGDVVKATIVGDVITEDGTHAIIDGKCVRPPFSSFLAPFSFVVDGIMGSMNPWGPFVAAAATFAAALVALFKEDIVKKWRHPDLHIRMLLKPPDCVLTPTVVTGSHNGATFEVWRGKCFYFRLWVENRGHLAERVQVYINSVSHQMGDGRCEIVPEFIPMNLRWADSPEGKPLIFETLNPYMGKYCDFATVSPPTNPTETIREGMNQGESTFNLQTEVFSNNEGHRLKPGKYKIELLVAASNARPKTFTVNLDWNGRFEETTARMYVESVKVKIVG